MHIGYVPRERPPISALNFHSGAYNFHKLQKKSVPEHHHFTFFGVLCHSRETIIFKISLISTRSSPPTAGWARTAAPRFSSRPERQPDASWQFRRLIFHAQNGSSSFRSPAFSSSKRLKLVPEPRIFTLDRELVPEPGAYISLCPRHILAKIWGEYPPPPPPPPRI